MSDAMTVSERKTPRRAWAVLAVVYLASVSAPIVQFKIPALSSWLFPAFALDATSFGFLMSALSIVAVILAFPTAFIIRKIGLKAMMIFSLATLAGGAVLSVLAAPDPMGGGNLTLLYAGRLLEGVGLGCVGVVGPSCLSVWFPEKTRGFALGIWATWIPAGSVLTLNLAPRIAATAGDWRIVFWISAAICAIALVLFAIVFKMPEKSESDTSQFEGTVSDALKILKNRDIWILGVVFLIFNGILVGISSSYNNTFIEQVLGFSAQEAGSIASLSMLLPIVVAPITGAIFDRMPAGKRKYYMAFAMLVMFVGMFFLFTVGDSAILHMWIFVGIGGVLGGLCAGSCRPMAPLVMPATALGATMSMAVLQFMQNIGQAVYSPLFGALLDNTGDWQFSLWVIALPTAALAVVLCLFIRERQK